MITTRHFRVLPLFLFLLLPSGLLSAQDRWTEQVREQFEMIDEIGASEGFRQVGEIRFGRMDQGERASHRFRLQQGRLYAFVAACDDDCSDIDLFVRDASGSSVGSDVRVGETAFVSVEADRSGMFEAEARMYSCSVEPCRYGIALYEAGGSGGPSTVSDRFGGSLEQGGQTVHALRLEGGSTYRIEGDCDGCRDLDLFLETPDGSRVTADLSVTTTPAITHRPDRAAQYRLRVRMYSCAANECAYDVRVIRNP